MKYFFDNIKNNIDFYLRNHLVFSRKDYAEKPNTLSYLRNIYYFNIFEKYFSKKQGELSILDIGSKNWEYVKGEYYFFNTLSKNFILNGIELDAQRLNNAFYSRFEIAKYYTKDLKNTSYIFGDFLKHKQKYDYIIWILPFITEHPLIKWGLPLKYFKPDEMLSHAYNLLNDKGEMLIINQGEKEYEIQKELNQKLKTTVKYYGEIEDKHNLFINKRYCSKIIKNY